MDILLSLCIPTYNRAGILKNTVESILADPGFNENVEIIISDNCSTDNTESVCLDICARCNRVHYYRNKENIIDRNFYKVLTYASGKYLKLINDTVSFYPGKLLKLLEFVAKTPESSNLLFSKTSEINKKITECYCFSPKDILNNISYNITWLSTFGIWKTDFTKYCSLEDNFASKLIQAEWILNLSTKKKTIIVFDDYYKIVDTKKKGSYNFYKVFTDNYFSIIAKYVGRKCLEIEKYRILRHYLLPLSYNIYIRKDNYLYDKSSFISCLFKHYSFHIYIVPLCLLYVLSRFVRDKLKN